MFDWDTPLACVDLALNKTCQVKGEGHLYDLSDLVITKGMKEGNIYHVYISMFKTYILQISKTSFVIIFFHWEVNIS
jgi:hypothetical protein